DALWIAIADTRRPVRDSPLLHLDLAGDAVVGTPPFAGGQVRDLKHVGRRLIASVEKTGTESWPASIVAVDWRSGNVLARRDFPREIGPLVAFGGDLWALQLEPAALWRIDLRTLAPNAPRLALHTGRGTGLAAGAGYLWVGGGDTGDVLRIDPARHSTERVHLGGAPAGLLVTAGRPPGPH